MQFRRGHSKLSVCRINLKYASTDENQIYIQGAQPEEPKGDKDSPGSWHASHAGLCFSFYSFFVWFLYFLLLCVCLSCHIFIFVFSKSSWNLTKILKFIEVSASAVELKWRCLLQHVYTSVSCAPIHSWFKTGLFFCKYWRDFVIVFLKFKQSSFSI